MFSHWQDEEGNIVSYDNPYIFDMPDHDVTLIAVFEEEVLPVFDVNSLNYSMNAKIDFFGNWNWTYATVEGTMTASYTNGNPYNGNEKFIVTVTLSYGWPQEVVDIPVTVEFEDGEGDVVPDAEWTFVCYYPNYGVPSITSVTRVVP